MKNKKPQGNACGGRKIYEDVKEVYTLRITGAIPGTPVGTNPLTITNGK
jgi:hypothetical protein